MIGKSITVAVALGLLMSLPAQAGTGYPNLLERIEREGTFKTFVKALGAAGLANDLTGSESWTVLAPTDEAFGQLPAGTIDGLLKPENKDNLAEMLKGHLIPGKVFASTWANEKVRLKTQAGDEVAVDGSGYPFLVNDARIIRLNVGAANGMIHVIDQVLLPPAS
jgi:uncharacterized surface protein with fasciclin (FAS1) repeats